MARKKKRKRNKVVHSKNKFLFPYESYINILTKQYHNASDVIKLIELEKIITKSIVK